MNTGLTEKQARLIRALVRRLYREELWVRREWFIRVMNRHSRWIVANTAEVGRIAKQIHREKRGETPHGVTPSHKG